MRHERERERGEEIRNEVLETNMKKSLRILERGKGRIE